MLLNIKNYILPSQFKNPNISKTESNTQKNEYSYVEGDRADDGDIDDGNDNSDKIDNEGGDDDNGGGDANDSVGCEDKSNEGSDTDDDGGIDHDGDNGGNDGDDDDGFKVDGSNQDVGLDNVNAKGVEIKVDPVDVYGGNGHSNDDGEVDDFGCFDTNDGDDAKCGDIDCEFDCGDDLDGGDGIKKDHNDGEDDGDVDSIISNDANCGDGMSKVDCSKGAAGDDSNSNTDGVPNNDGSGNTDYDGKGGNDSDRESNCAADGHRTDDCNDNGCLGSIATSFFPHLFVS